MVHHEQRHLVGSRQFQASVILPGKKSLKHLIQDQLPRLPQSVELQQIYPHAGMSVRSSTVRTTFTCPSDSRSILNKLAIIDIVTRCA